MKNKHSGFSGSLGFVLAAAGSDVGVALGKRILRTETAGLAVMAMLGYLLEE